MVSNTSVSPACIQLWEDFWERRNSGPLFSLTFPRGSADFSPRIKPWMAPGVVGSGWSLYKHEFLFGQAVELASKDGDLSRLEDALDYFEFYFTETSHAGGGFPFLYANLGAMMMSAFLTGFTRFNGDTIWLECDPPLEWEDLRRIHPGTRAPYTGVALAALDRLCRRLGGKAVISFPELGSPPDILSALRGAQNLCLDLMDEPEQVQGMLSTLDLLRRGFTQEIQALVDPANGGLHTVTMRYLSAKPFGMGMCDVSAMLSPSMFEEFCLRWLHQEMEDWSGRAVYHMDGPGQIPHTPLLCREENLFGVQWVSGAGNPGNLDPRWDPLYRQLLDAGKRVFFASVPHRVDPIRTFFKRFPAREFYLPFTFASEAQALPFLNLARELGSDL